MTTEQQSHREWVTVTIGEPYEGIPGPRDEGPTYNFQHGSHTLTNFVQRPTSQEIHVYRNNPVRIGFWKDGPVLWAIFHIQGLGWQDAPYTPHKVDPDARDFPELDGHNTRYLLVITLADAIDGKVKVLRMATMSPELSQQLRGQVQELLNTEFSEEEFNRRIEETYRKYPTSAHMKDLPPRLDPLGTP